MELHSKGPGLSGLERDESYDKFIDHILELTKKVGTKMDLYFANKRGYDNAYQYIAGREEALEQIITKEIWCRDGFVKIDQVKALIRTTMNSNLASKRNNIRKKYQTLCCKIKIPNSLPKDPKSVEIDKTILQKKQTGKVIQQTIAFPEPQTQEKKRGWMGPQNFDDDLFQQPV